MPRAAALWAVVAALLWGTTTSEGQQDAPRLLVLLVDGLRWDAINTTHPCSPQHCPDDSFFTLAQQEGVTAAWNSPVFPTTPLPNLYSMATGALPAQHGVLGEGWRPRRATPTVWGRAARSGRKTALLRWLSCETVQVQPNLACFDHVPLQGVDNLLVQLVGDAAIASQLLIDDGYSVVMLRTQLVSWASEQFGPGTPPVAELITQTKTILDNLFQELISAGLWQQMTVVIVSTNGMTDTGPEAAVAVPVAACLPDLTAPTYRYLSAGSAIVRTEEGATDQVLQTLDECDVVLAGAMRVFGQSQLPEVDRWPDGEHDLLIAASKGFVLSSASGNASAEYPSSLGRLQVAEAAPVGQRMGGDGYEWTNSDMRGVFIAKGPGILRGVTGTSILQTEVYQVLCLVAGLSEDSYHGPSWMLVPSGATCVHCSIVMVLLATCTVLYSSAPISHNIQ